MRFVALFFVTVLLVLASVSTQKVELNKASQEIEKSKKIAANNSIVRKERHEKENRQKIIKRLAKLLKDSNKHRAPEIREKKCRVTPFDRRVSIWIYTCGTLYVFYGLAVVCETKFQHLIMEIASRMQLSDDVVGATFMAAGTSSPELFISLASLFMPGNSDMGAGTIIGSAIFNIAIIIGFSAIFRGDKIPSGFSLDWRPVIRDCLVNFVTFLFLLVIFLDGKITWTESCITLLLYGGYIFAMSKNQKLLLLIDKYVPGIVDKLSKGRVSVASELDSSFVDLGTHEEVDVGGSLDNRVRKRGKLKSSSIDIPVLPVKPDKLKTSSLNLMAVEEEEEHLEVDLPVVREWSDVWVWVRVVFRAPYTLMFSTIPAFRGKPARVVAAAFAVCLLWLGALTWVMVQWSTQIGCILNLSDSVLGVTLLAVGTSTPDLLTSVYVARSGNGDMAVSNALGSNVFDVLIALGLPWFLFTSMGLPIEVDAGGILLFTGILFFTLFGFLAALWFNDWVLDSKVGSVLVVFYVVFCVFFLITAG